MKNVRSMKDSNECEYVSSCLIAPDVSIQYMFDGF